MSTRVLDIEEADRNLTNFVTVLTHTPSAVNTMRCGIGIILGYGGKNLTGAGGVFQFTVSVGGQVLQPSPVAVVFGPDVRALIDTRPFLVTSTSEVVVQVKSPNGGDTSVSVSAYIYDASAVDVWHWRDTAATNNPVVVLAAYVSDATTPTTTEFTATNLGTNPGVNALRGCVVDYMMHDSAAIYGVSRTIIANTAGVGNVSLLTVDPPLPWVPVLGDSLQITRGAGVGARIYELYAALPPNFVELGIDVDGAVLSVIETGQVTGNVDGSVGSVAGNVDGTVKLASDGLNNVDTTPPTATASNFREMVIQTWRRWFRKSTLDRNTNKLTTFADDGSTPMTEQNISDTGGVETLGDADE